MREAKSRALQATVVAALLLCAGTARAALITWEFTGALRLINDAATSTGLPSSLAELGVEIGAPVVGSLRFDSSAADVRPEPDSSLYPFSIDAMAVSIGGWTLTRSPVPSTDALSAVISVLYSTAPYPELWDEVTIVDLLDPTGTLFGTAGDFSLVYGGLELWSGFPADFGSDAMLIEPPPLGSLAPFGWDPTSDFGYGSDLYVVGCRGEPANGCFEFRAELTSLVRVVPEPGVLALASLAAAALLARRLARS